LASKFHTLPPFVQLNGFTSRNHASLIADIVPETVR